jgi:type II secretory ATPase GspE/PulE/Tfp pilus assembly ATPase PilB-like protein
MQRELNTEQVNLVTLEDPVEYNIGGVNQVQISEKTGMTFANGLRAILRQDPDIVAVGEIRDGETAEIAMRAALAGPLVLSTVHTNDALSTIDRLRDIGVESYLIAGALKGVISQRRYGAYAQTAAGNTRLPMKNSATSACRERRDSIFITVPAAPPARIPVIAEEPAFLSSFWSIPAYATV